jgi:hypothetical protein
MIWTYPPKFQLSALEGDTTRFLISPKRRPPNTRPAERLPKASKQQFAG